MNRIVGMFSAWSLDISPSREKIFLEEAFHITQHGNKFGNQYGL